MKKSDQLSLNMANKLEPIFKFDWLPTNLPILTSAAIIFAMVVVIMQYRQQTNVPDNKSMAWFMANPKEALATNKICFDNPQLQNTENCLNSLHALEITHKGPNS